MFSIIETCMINERTGFKGFFFLMFASYSGYVMFRNVYLQEIGMSGTQMGIIGFLFPLFTMLAQPLWGFVADWKHASKLILYVSAIVSGFSILVYPLAPSLSNTFLVVAVGTALFASFRAPAMPIANALVLSTGLSYEGVRAYGSIAFGITGLAVGFLIGVFVTELVFYIFTTGMVLVVALLFFLPVKDSDDALDTDLNLTAIRQLLDRQFALLLLAAFCIGLMTPAGSAFFSVYIREIGQADSITGMAWLVKTIGETVAFMYIAHRGGSYRRLMALGGLLYSSTYVVLLLTVDVRVVIVAQLMLGVGYALFNLASVNLAHYLSTKALKSTAQSLLMVGGASAGTGIGELLTGILVDLVGVQQMYGYVAGLGLLVALISLRIAGQEHDTSGTTDSELDIQGE